MLKSKSVECFGFSSGFKPSSGYKFQKLLSKNDHRKSQFSRLLEKTKTVSLP